ncbi:MAG: CRISPR-associated ring nuclease Csm6 [Sutterellaceae bacterium]|nr:CRISPR-associated ring nuclease Csm6 [Burkholderiaceae bacterium]MDW8430206.1 CRISPR-associated ring nuclease Csm6 [Sutterellaceae bacterium]
MSATSLPTHTPAAGAAEMQPALTAAPREMESRRILLCVTGLTPQVVTETLYALARPADGEAPWIPHEIHVITTTRGADNVRLSLLHPATGHFRRLCQDYNLPPIAFDDAHIHLMRRPDGSALEDIRDRADSAVAADAIASVVRTLTADPDSEVHASIAGGRKTMGFFLGYAMSLYGRPQDRLSHVLVSEPYESNPNFYYPTPDTQPIPRGRDSNEMIDAALARVWLADIPFVRLRSALTKEMRERADLAFAESVSAVQQTVAPSLWLDRRQQLVFAGGKRVALRRADFAFLAWALQRHLNNEALTRHRRLNEAAARRDAEQYLAEYARLTADPDDTETRTHECLARGLLCNFFDERRSRVNRAFQEALGEARAKPYLLQRVGPRGQSRYRFGLDAAAIHLR